MEKDYDEIDKKILNMIQSHFPVHPHPYRVLAEQMEISEEDVWKRIERLRSKGIIRRIGAIFNSSSLGFRSTLVGVKVDPDFLEAVAKKINQLSGITHHYQRNDAFNLWFTLTARDSKIIDQIVDQIRDWEGVMDILNLPSTRTFKIKVDFQI